MHAPFRVLFFGTPAFAVPTLEALLGSSHAVVGVVTQPDRPRGRGQLATDGPVKACALAHAVPLFQPSTLKDAALLDDLAALRPDIGVVAAYGKILPAALLALPPLGLLNVHASLLPRWRGAAPIHRAIMAGDQSTGVTIMRVVQALDAGAMLDQCTCPIPPDATTDVIERRLATDGAALMVSVLDRLRFGPVPEHPQDDARATYAHRIDRRDGLIDWTQPASVIHDQIRALHPWPHASCWYQGRRLIVWASTWTDEDSAGAVAGTILEASGDAFRVATGHGTVRLTQLQTEGGRPLPTKDFLAGHPFVTGAVFGGPA